jgi:hypothetical protein
LFNPCTCRGSPPAGNITRTFRPGRTDDAVDRLMRRHALTLIVSGACAPSTGLVCACTHYLVFKEPTAEPPEATLPRLLLRPTRRPSGNCPMLSASPTAFRGTFRGY